MVNTRYNHQVTTFIMRESLPPQERRPFREPMGMRLMGRQDPRELTRAEFLESEDVLYHAARESFAFDPFLDYTKPNPYDEMQGEGGMTLGAGFYTTPEYREALNYSVKRGGDKQKESRVYAFLPYHARILDLREKGNVLANGDVPKELVDEWTALVQKKCALLHEEYANKKTDFLDEWTLESWDEYVKRLEYIQAKGTTYDLRTILGTGDSPAARKELPSFSELHSQPWDTLWSRFMLYKGIDGIMYNEGSEVERGVSSTNIVFYDLTKIGTQESWHREQGHGSF